MMTLQEAFELYKTNKLQTLNRQQYAVLAALEAFDESSLTPQLGIDAMTSLARLWDLAIRL